MQRNPHAVSAALRRLAENHLSRQRQIVSRGSNKEPWISCQLGERRLLDFCSNNYLGLAQDPRVAAALSTAAASCGVGSGAAHLVSGHQHEHHALEEALAAFTGRERALLFSSGYQANLAVLSTLANRGDWLLLDRLNHASLIDGARLSGARFKRYPHADSLAVAEWLNKHALSLQHAGRGILLVTDGIFSMDGDIAPLTELAQLAQQYQTWLVVDDAHGLGVMGPEGRGSVAHCGLDSTQVPVLIGTLGKAFGTFGAFVAGDAALIELLLQTARPYIYTTALPPALAAASRAALKIAMEESWRREHVLSLVMHFRAGAQQLALPLLPSQSPIQPLKIGSAAQALAAQEALAKRGFWVAAIRPPTVPLNSARLRITLSAAHSIAQVDSLLAALADIQHVFR